MINVGVRFESLEHITVTDDEVIRLEEVQVVFNNVDITTPGVYEVTYQVSDAYSATSSKTIRVTVKDPAPNNQAPALYVKDVVLFIGSLFNPLDFATVEDDYDQDLSIRVVANTVDTNQSGVYAVTYETTDSKGLKATETSQVVVLDLITESITLDSNFEEGDAFDALDYIKNLEKMDKLNADVKIEIIENTVNTKVPGDYHITYEIIDSIGGSAIKTTNVKVLPKKPLKADSTEQVVTGVSAFSHLSISAKRTPHLLGS